MKRTRRVVAAGAGIVLALSLAACGGNSTSESKSTATAVDTSKLPEFSGEKVGVDTSTEVPTLSFPETKGPKDLDVQVLEEGTGNTITESDFVVVDYVGQVWRADKPFDSSYSRKAPLASSLSGLVKGWAKGLAGHKVGSKLIINIPPGALGYEGGNDSAGIGANDVMTFYVEVHQAWSLLSAGQADATPEASLDSLPITYDGAIGSPITAASPRDTSAKVSAFSSSVIARGTGEKIAAKGNLYVAYYLVTADGTKRESTWVEGVGVQQIRMGTGSLFDKLAGTEVGSRVFMAVPATESNGSTASASPDLYVVADLLGYYGG